MLRFILRRRTRYENGEQGTDFFTLDARNHPLERALRRGGVGPDGFDLTELVGVELLENPAPTAAELEEINLAHEALHPNGHCTCHGEGRCRWCAWAEASERLLHAESEVIKLAKAWHEEPGNADRLVELARAVDALDPLEQEVARFDGPELDDMDAEDDPGR